MSKPKQTLHTNRKKPRSVVFCLMFSFQFVFVYVRFFSSKDVFQYEKTENLKYFQNLSKYYTKTTETAGTPV